MAVTMKMDFQLIQTKKNFIKTFPKYRWAGYLKMRERRLAIDFNINSNRMADILR